MGGHYPPTKSKELEKCLTRLGFVKNRRVGKGKHVATYTHPTKNPSNAQRPYITIPHKIDNPNFAKAIVKQIMAFEFTEEEVMIACGKKIRK
jgi:predicted RNA binding protein YcfA (HicA-like mRNA interferase family)